MLILPGATAMLLVRIWIYQTTDLLFAEGYCMQDSEQSLLHPNSARYAPVVCPVAPPFMCVYKFFPPKGQLMIALGKTQRCLAPALPFCDTRLMDKGRKAGARRYTQVKGGL